MARGFDHQKIEAEAQEKWAELNLYQTDLSDESKEPYYLLFEFPYPSGDLHIGHWYAFAVTDIYARMLRMQGRNVLFPIGFDAFGLPAENAAIRNGVDPRVWTYENMDRMRTQIRSMGISVDWTKEVITCDPNYYKWTQWLFTKLFEHGLAERKEARVKWCPKDQTVLANEQVIDGHCERCGSIVEERALTQWFLKITQYAERLLNDLDALPWREEIKEAQRAWIGKSEGANIAFKVVPAKDADPVDAEIVPDVSITVFTTRPDTIYGATYVVVAPEHPLLNELLETLENETDVAAYIEATKQRSERERQEEKEKTGVRLEGVMAVNPATKEQIPVYVADYVLGSYGTGAVMAVPAHDERDFEFASKYHLPITQVVRPVFGAEDRKPDAVYRDTISAFVKSKDGERILLLKWKEYDWLTAVIGGIDEDETPEEAAVREVFEETGYRVRPVYVSPIKVESHFFAEHKNEWRARVDTPVLLELIEDSPELVTDEEAKKHEVQWTMIDDALAKDGFGNNKLAMRLALGMGAYTEPLFGETCELVDSGDFSGRDNREALWDVVAAAGGKRVTQYRLRDWLVSRQRYWGCPIPIVYDPEGKPHAIPAEHLPWRLPTDVDFTPTGNASPLASSEKLKEKVEAIFGEGWTPEYDTLDTFVDSSWYFTRYLDPRDENNFSDQAFMKKWLPVNRYSGGSEHTTMHLLYARFFYKALYDLALVPTSEPFNERYNRGIILGPDGAKMSKSKGNVINPDDFVKEYGADAVRMYLAFIGPYNEPGHYPWNLDGVASMRKFLERIARLIETSAGWDFKPKFERKLDSAIARAIEMVGRDSERFKFNTAISALMILLNEFEGDFITKEHAQILLRLLAPFAPHLAEHLWSQAGGEGNVHVAPWPTYDASVLHEDYVSVVVQVNGKKRGEVSVPRDTGEDAILEISKQIESVARALEGKDIKKQVYVPGRILNLVV